MGHKLKPHSQWRPRSKHLSRQSHQRAPRTTRYAAPSQRNHNPLRHFAAHTRYSSDTQKRTNRQISHSHSERPSEYFQLELFQTRRRLRSTHCEKHRAKHRKHSKTSWSLRRPRDAASAQRNDNPLCYSPANAHHSANYEERERERQIGDCERGESCFDEYVFYGR